MSAAVVVSVTCSLSSTVLGVLSWSGAMMLEETQRLDSADTASGGRIVEVNGKGQQGSSPVERSM